MSETRTRRPAVQGWFTEDGEPSLLGKRCTDCGTYFFPPEITFCRNPHCAGGDALESVPLSRRGRLWSFTNNCYPPPKPYMAPDPFEPYAIAAVELEREKMVVLGQVVPGVGVEALEAGMEMELVVETLFADDEAEHTVWKWRPAARRPEAG